MGIVVSNAFALSEETNPGADYPIILWDNLVTIDTVTADHADANFPVSNLGNPATNLVWKSGSTADQKLTCLFDEAIVVDAAGLARHNLGTGLCPVIVQGLPPGGVAADDGDWIELVASQLLANDKPALFRFTPTNLIGLRLALAPAAVAPQAAIFSVGKLLIFERGVQPGHTPIPYARRHKVLSPRSQSGEYLGRIVEGGSLGSTVTITRLTPAWYRATLDPFFEASAEIPFFWAWSPQSYPNEVGFVWLDSDPVPNPSHLRGYMDISLQMTGLAL